MPRRVHAEGEQHDPVLLWQLDRHDSLVQRRLVAIIAAIIAIVVVIFVVIIFVVVFITSIIIITSAPFQS